MLTETEVVVLNTTTLKYEEMAYGDYKFAVCEKQCAQAGKDKVIALVDSCDENELS